MEYKGNSNLDNDKKIVPVLRGDVKANKESVGKKLANTFLAETITNVGKHMVSDVIVPAITDMIVDSLTDGISMLFKGTPYRYRSSFNGKTNYTSFSRGSSFSWSTPRDSEVIEKNRFGVYDISFTQRPDAIEVRNCLAEVIDRYGFVPICDYYEFSKHSELIQYTDNKYGWDNLGNADIIRGRDGRYRITLPKPEPLG